MPVTQSRCPSCAGPAKSFGACPRCHGRGCEACGGIGQIIVCEAACSQRPRRESPVDSGPSEQRGRPDPIRPTELTFAETREASRIRRGQPTQRRENYDHHFVKGRCTVCGSLEMLARPNRWSCQ